MKRTLFSLTALILALSISPTVSAKDASATSAAQPSKKDVLARLKTIQDQQISQTEELDKAIRKQLQETLTMQLKADEPNVANRRTTLLTKKIDELNKRREEVNARREIVDRLIFQIDSKWSNQPLQQFLEQTFIEMASTDLSDGRDNRLWKEFTYLSMVMREVPEANEDMINVFQGYLNYSNVLEPKSPAEYLASRNYTNGTETAIAHQAPRDAAGDGVSNPEQPLIVKAPLVAAATPPPAADGTSSATTVSAGSPATTWTPVPAALQQTPAQQQAARVPQPPPETPKTVIVIGPTPVPTATAPPTPISSARTNELTNPPNTVSGTSQGGRGLTAPASEAGLHR